MTPLVRLEDARGCWRVVPQADVRLVSAEAVVLKGAAWAKLPFDLYSNEGPMTVYRARRAAIGHHVQPFVPALHLPEGWHAPKDPS